MSNVRRGTAAGKAPARSPKAETTHTRRACMVTMHKKKPADKTTIIKALFEQDVLKLKTRGKQAMHTFLNEPSSAFQGQKHPRPCVTLGIESQIVQT